MRLREPVHLAGDPFRVVIRLRGEAGGAARGGVREDHVARGGIFERHRRADPHRREPCRLFLRCSGEHDEAHFLRDCHSGWQCLKLFTLKQCAKVS